MWEEEQKICKMNIYTHYSQRNKRFTRAALSQAPTTKVKPPPSESSWLSTSECQGNFRKWLIWEKKIHKTDINTERRAKKYEALKTKITAGNTQIPSKAQLRVPL